MTMRKIYISPMTEKYVIQSNPLLGGSIFKNKIDFASVDVETSEDYGDVFCSRSAMWDDEEDNWLE